MRDRPSNTYVGPWTPVDGVGHLPGWPTPPAHFARTDELLREFPVSWHGKRVANIGIPVPFDSSGANQGGFVADA